MAFSKARRLSDLISATGEVASYADASIVPADLHSTLDLTGKTITVANTSTGDSDTTVANTAFVQQEIAALVASAPGTLNTLNELAAALGDDASFSTTVTDSIATKLPLAGGTMAGNLTVNAILDADNFKINNAQGTDGQVMTSTGSGVAWEDAAESATISSSAPSSPAQGDMWFNSSASTVSNIETKSMSVYDGTNWVQMSNQIFSATGGTITTSGAYTIHTFTSSGTFTPNLEGNIDYLIIGGGGAGTAAGAGAGGGGAGGFLTAAGHAVIPQAYTITIGAGGTGVTGNTYQTVAPNGSNTTALGFTAVGGGGGAGGEHPGASGGSGGGGNGGYGSAGGAGTSGQGNAGGAGISTGSDNYAAGGGGGAGSAGGGASANGGAGGSGLANSYSGSSVTYAGGGGGGIHHASNGNPGAGGSGGGGAGGDGDGANGVNATANTGSGGGGSGGYTTISTGGNGASGIVILRYLT